MKGLYDQEEKQMDELETDASECVRKVRIENPED